MKGIGAYRAARKKASPEQLVLLLYREALRRLDGLKSAPADDARWVGDTHHVRAILLELSDALDPEAAPELCGQLQRLYLWCMSELVTAGREREPARIVAVHDVVRDLHDGWEAVVSRPQEGLKWAS
jgi:flagellar biosynthetic protein FliS